MPLALLNRTLSPAPYVRPPGVEVRCIQRWNELAALGAPWNALAERSATSTVFQTFEWHCSWWKAFGRHGEPLVLLARDEGGDLVAVAPLMRLERRVCGRRRRVLQFIGTFASDYSDVIVDRERLDVLPVILRWLADHRGDWDVLDLRNVPHTSPLLTRAPAFLTEAGFASDVRLFSAAPTRLLGHAEADRELLRKKSLRRHHNFFARQGRLECIHLSGAPEILAWLDRFFQQHIERWDATDTPSQFLEEEQRLFYREMVAALGPTGWLLFSVVLLDGEPLATHLGFQYGHRLIWYKPTYNVRFARHSPGEVLIKSLFEYALEHGFSELDFTVGEEAFKYRFANHSRTVHSIHAFPDPLTRRCDRLIDDARRWAKTSPALTSIVRRIKFRSRRKAQGQLL